MSSKKSTNKFTPMNMTLLVVAGLLLVLMIVLVVMLLNRNKGNNGEQQTTTTPSTSELTVPSSETQNETTTNSIEETTEIVSSQDVTEATSLPDQTFGKWDLSTLENKDTPYGNSADDVDSYGIPNGVFWYTSKWGQYNVDFISDIALAVHRGESTSKTIYLTMDCGFDNEQTGPILDILKEKNVKATFFVTSMFYDARPDLIQRMINEGHRIGSHSINHVNMTTLSIEQQTNEIMDVVNKLKNDYNYDCRLFRYPQGQFSDQSLALVDNLGLKSVFWSYAYNDYSSVQPEVQPSYEKAVKYLHPGAIYLLHASSSTNRAFLGDWIDAARNQGYEFGGVYPVD